MIPTDEQTNKWTAALREVSGRIAAAASRAGRSTHDITLIAVSKTHPAEIVKEVWQAGQTIFGESRVQEALPKMDALANFAADAVSPNTSSPATAASPLIVWHLIGHLQTNKAREAVGRFDLIHSVDSPRLIAALESRAAQLSLTQRILLQLNVSGEASKFGAPPSDLSVLLEALAAAPHLRAEGLMMIPPYDDDPETSRPHFARLRELLQSLPPSPHFTPRHLSMGMSGDFEVAIEEGATLIRVGTAIFGER